jgi:hypothetical protein
MVNSDYFGVGVHFHAPSDISIYRYYKPEFMKVRVWMFFGKHTGMRWSVCSGRADSRLWFAQIIFGVGLIFAGLAEKGARAGGWDHYDQTGLNNVLAPPIPAPSF